MLNKLSTLKVKNGRYARMQVIRILDNAVQYSALFIKNDGYTEKRICTVRNNTVVAWQS